MSFNTRSPAVKRLLKEAQELNEPHELFYAQPLEENIFEWHFTIRGPPDTDFDGGIYHGRILLPAEYPMKPPSIIMLTANGRFKTNEKICLSISGHHPETWLPSWSIRTAMLALIGFMPTMGEGAIGSLDYTSEERKSLAKKSVSFACSICQSVNSSILPILTEKSNNECKEAKELAAQIQFKNNKPGENKENSSEATIEPSGLIKRNVESSGIPSGINNLESSNILNQQAPAQSENSTFVSSAQISQSRREENSFFLLFIFALTALFLFLFVRRIFLFLDNGALPI